MKQKRENPPVRDGKGGQNLKIKSTPKVILNRSIKFVKNLDSSSIIELPPVTTLYLEKIAKKLNMEPEDFFTWLIQGVNSTYEEPWRPK